MTDQPTSLPRRLRAWAVIGAGTLVLAACAPVAVRNQPGTVKQLAAQAAREHLLAADSTWSLEGRFAASDGQHGGSGSLSWQQNGQRYQFTLRAPITGKSVQLNGGPDGAILSGMGKQIAGDDASDVLNQQFGWNVPVEDLAWWIRGLRAPGRPAILTFGANGLPATMEQDGWHVDYRDWYAERNPPLPRKVYASRDPYKVRVLVETWQVAAPPAADAPVKP